MRILLVEDDDLIGSGTQTGLRQRGIATDWVTTSRLADAALQADRFDGMALDLGLPDESGLDLLARLRRREQQLPVLILTARDAIEDRVAGLDAGADDYLVKPFDLDELAARLRAIIRRGQGRSQGVIEHGGLRLEPAGRCVTLDGTPANLSRREFDLLQALLEASGRVVTAEQLEQTLYGWGEELESNAIQVHIHHLRRKLGNTLIRTVRGVGYTIDRER